MRGCVTCPAQPPMPSSFAAQTNWATAAAFSVPTNGTIASFTFNKVRIPQEWIFNLPTPSASNSIGWQVLMQTTRGGIDVRYFNGPLCDHLGVWQTAIRIPAEGAQVIVNEVFADGPVWLMTSLTNILVTNIAPVEAVVWKQRYAGGGRILYSVFTSTNCSDWNLVSTNSSMVDVFTNAIGADFYSRAVPVFTNLNQ